MQAAAVPAPNRSLEYKTRDIIFYCPVKQETKRAEAPRLQVSSGFTWDEGLNALEVPVLNRKEESSDSEEEDDTQSMVQYPGQHCVRGSCCNLPSCHLLSLYR